MSLAQLLRVNSLHCAAACHHGQDAVIGAVKSVCGHNMLRMVNLLSIIDCQRGHMGFYAGSGGMFQATSTMSCIRLRMPCLINLT